MSGDLNNETQQLTVSNRAFARGQRIFNEDILPWLSQQFGIKDWVLRLVPAEDADRLRDEQLVSARLDNARKALEIGLEVEWLESGYTISGTPQLQEAQNPPISLPAAPDVPSNTGEVAKADGSSQATYIYNYWPLEKADCPPGQHKHTDHDYCHPEDRQHRRDNDYSDTAAAENIKEAAARIQSLKDAPPVCTLKSETNEYPIIESGKNTDAFFKKNLTYDREHTAEEIKSIVDYTKGSKHINGLLDGDPESFAESEGMSSNVLNDFANQTTHIDSAIEQTTLSKGLTVYRGMDGSIAFGTTDYNSLINKNIIRDGYTSTSPLRSVADKYAAMEDRVQNPVILKLEIPPGKGIGIYVRDFSDRKDEYEFLLKRNIKYIISKVDKKNGRTEITARLME